MSYTRNIQDLTDEGTSSEALSSLASSIAFGIITNEQAFYDMVRAYDELLGRKSPSSFTIADIINDNTRSWYLYMTSMILHETRFTMAELLRCLERMKQVVLLDKDGKPKKKPSYVRASNLHSAIGKFCQYTDFEPVWHMRKRGDDRRLPTDRGKDLWGFLNQLYMDPEYARLRVPDGIRKLYPMYPGYEDCVKAAIKDGQEELRRIYGPDVDLTPVAEIRKGDGVDYDSIGASFMAVLRGSMAQ